MNDYQPPPDVMAQLAQTGAPASDDLIELVRASEERFRAVFEYAPIGIALTDLQGQIFASNRAMQMILGYDADALASMHFKEYTHPDDVEADVSRFVELAAGRLDHYQMEKRFVRRDGRTVWGRLTVALVRRADGTPHFEMGIVEDITDQRLAQEALTHRALHDELTGLPNRRLLSDRLQQAIASAQRTGAPVALLLLDLDRFKDVNDTFGHHVGDLILEQVGLRLRAQMRSSDTVARLGGDEFALVLSDTNRRTAARVARKVMRALERPLRLSDQAFHVSASVGIALYPAHGKEGDKLLRYADVAMYAAKQAGSGLAVYDQEQDPNSPSRLSLMTELRHAIQRNELILHFQPKIHLASGEVRGVEALVRWPHAAHGLLEPDEFIPLAEHTGVIKPLTAWVLGEAVRQHRLWQDQGVDLPVAVNLSARTLRDPRLIQTVTRTLARAEVEPTSLCLEITESSIMADPAVATRLLERLRHLGVRIAIDDFGTGYSSLAHLKRLPLDELKIDKDFVLGMLDDEDDAAIVQSVVDLGHNLGLEVVAEGVQHGALIERLIGLGCDLAQGFYLAHPLPPSDLPSWLKVRRLALAAGH